MADSPNGAQPADLDPELVELQAKAELAQQQVKEAIATVASEDGSATVTVGPNGSLVNLRFTERAYQRSPEELVRYSFEALQALAWERGVGRNPDETPLEFAARLGADLPAVESEARRLVALYARAAYARGRLPTSCLPAVRQFWQCLEGAAESPLSA